MEHKMQTLDTGTCYRMPPPEVAALLDAPSLPEFIIAPGGKRALILQPAGLRPLTELAHEELRLAGLRFNPDTLTSGRRAGFTGLSILETAGRRQRLIEGLPDQARLDWVTWSPGGEHIAFTATAHGQQGLWIVNPDDCRAVQLADIRPNAIAGMPYRWLPDARGLVCLAFVSDRQPPPAPPAVPPGPVVTETVKGPAAAARTNPDLLRNDYDEALFGHYLESELCTVDLSGNVRRPGFSGIIIKFEPSPDGNYFLVQFIQRPFSRLVPYNRFPLRTLILDSQGRPVRTMADLPSAETLPIGRDAARTGPRSFNWRADQPATLSWLEAEDGGDPAVAKEIRDRLFTLAAPFNGAPTEVAALALRCNRILWGHDNLALIYEEWWKTRTVRVWRIAPGFPDTAPRLLFNYGQQDRYAHPGTPLLRMTATGHRLLITHLNDETLLLVGPGAGPEGDRPFLDALNTETGKKQRLWQSSAACHEQPLTVAGGQHLWFTRETVTDPPDLFRLSLDKGGDEQRLTKTPHPYPALANVTKEIIRYRRADGVNLTGQLYLPPGKTVADGPFPTLLWAYPSEYKDAASAGQVKTSPNRFPVLDWRSPLLWLLRGYAVLDRPDVPVIGANDTEPNDTYIEQLVASAEAAVNELVRRKVADRNRIAVGGHSYGAFMTANLLAHSCLFRAGIARSGAYNRTLTPFGFQAEDRTLWQAPEVYMRMSPFLHADRISDPILIIHGQADENEGTFTMQSERLYHALKGLGKAARLVLLPFEGHAYRARESVMHMLWETGTWLERHL